MRAQNLTAPQLDGIACVRCGDEHAPMRPLPGWGPRGQLFECSTHTEEKAA